MAEGGLLDFFKSPEGQGLLGVVAGAMSGNGSARQNIGRGLLSGIGAYGNAQDNLIQQQAATQRNKLFDAQMQNYQAEADARRLAAERQQQQQNYLGSIGKVTSPVAGAQPNQLDPFKAISLGIPVDTVKTLANAKNLGKSAIKDYKEVRMPDGSVQIVGFDEYGNQQNTGAQPFKAPEFRDLGGKQVALDPVTLKPVWTGSKTMTPGEAAANAVARGNLAVSQQRLAFDREQPKGQYDAARGVLIDPRTGTARAVTMDGAPIGGKAHDASEGERKAASLLTRLRGSQRQLQAAIDGAPAATKPEWGAETLRNIPWVGGDTPANLVTSSARQRVEAAQLDMLDAALTLGTGAAYTKEQLRGYAKSYFPQIGDDDATVADKQQRLNNVIQAAEIAAGRAGSAVPVPGGSSGWKMEKVK